MKVHAKKRKRKKIGRKNGVKKTEIVVRHFSPDSRAVRIITRRPVIIFLDVLFFAERERERRRSRRSRSCVVRYGVVEVRRCIAREGRGLATINRDTLVKSVCRCAGVFVPDTCERQIGRTLCHDA